MMVPRLVVLVVLSLGTLASSSALAAHTPEFWVEAQPYAKHHPETRHNYTNVQSSLAAIFGASYLLSQGGDDVAFFDLMTGEWSGLLTDTGGQHFQINGLGLASGDRFFVVAGSTCEPGLCHNTDRFRSYNVSTDLWTTLAPLPTPRSNAAGGLVDGEIYVIGGGTTILARDSDPLAMTEIYDIESGTWRDGPPLPTARFHPLSTVLPDGRIVVAGGITRWDSTNFWPTDVVEVLDPATETWSTLAPLPEELYAGVLGLCAGHMYAVGGQHQTQPRPDPTGVYRYDFTTDTWTDAPSLPDTPAMGNDFLFARNAISSDDLDVFVAATISDTFVFNCAEPAFPVPELSSLPLLAVGLVALGMGAWSVRARRPR